MPSPWIYKTCEECGRDFRTRHSQARTCSPKCRAILREKEKPSPGRPERDYPPDVVLKVQEMYAAGATVLEVGAAIGPGYKAQTLIERFVEQRRPAIPRDQTGGRNPLWKGDDAGYAALHLRVEAARGKPCRCALCDTTDPAVRYHWANLSGHYEDIYDYARLCAACHVRLDHRRRAELGRPTRPAREVMRVA